MNAPRLVGREFVQHMRDSAGEGSPAMPEYVGKRSGNRGEMSPDQVRDANKKQARLPRKVKSARTELPNKAAFEQRLKKLAKSNPEVAAQIARRMAK